MASLFQFMALGLVLLAGSTNAWAHPVSFKDGWGIMPSYSSDESDLQINYSITNRHALGLSAFRREGEDSTTNFGIGQFNYLVERWNELESQANIYASLGVGGRSDTEHDSGFAGYGALSADYETRRIYTVLAAETLQSANAVDFNKLRYRAGIAPYLAPFHALQTWIVVQVDYRPEMKDETVVTPLLRLFYNNYAVEVGASLDGDPFLGAMAHF